MTEGATSQDTYEVTLTDGKDGDALPLMYVVKARNIGEAIEVAKASQAYLEGSSGNFVKVRLVVRPSW